MKNYYNVPVNQPSLLGNEKKYLSIEKIEGRELLNSLNDFDLFKYSLTASLAESEIH